MRKILFSMLVTGVFATGIQAASAMDDGELGCAVSRHLRGLPKKEIETLNAEWSATLDEDFGRNKKRGGELLNNNILKEKNTPPNKRRKSSNKALSQDIESAVSVTLFEARNFYTVEKSFDDEDKYIIHYF